MIIIIPRTGCETMSQCVYNDTLCHSVITFCVIVLYIYIYVIIIPRT